MATFTYWVAPCIGDGRCYGIRGKRRRDVMEKLAALAVDSSAEWVAKSWGTPVKISIEYDSMFDLVEQCLSEGGVE